MKAGRKSDEEEEEEERERDDVQVIIMNFFESFSLIVESSLLSL